MGLAVAGITAIQPDFHRIGAAVAGITAIQPDFHRIGAAVAGITAIQPPISPLRRHSCRDFCNTAKASQPSLTIRR
jgi:hypothetical protein